MVVGGRERRKEGVGLAFQWKPGEQPVHQFMPAFYQSKWVASGGLAGHRALALTCFVSCLLTSGTGGLTEAPGRWLCWLQAASLSSGGLQMLPGEVMGGGGLCPFLSQPVWNPSGA